MEECKTTADEAFDNKKRLECMLNHTIYEHDDPGFGCGKYFASYTYEGNGVFSINREECEDINYITLEELKNLSEWAAKLTSPRCSPCTTI